ncbi:hypothetical protein WG66_014615 [Moniliophthora roreri]|nr:hypothetical protein WG66_014615 [Moniliophthora roreri]
MRGMNQNRTGQLCYVTRSRTSTSRPSLPSTAAKGAAGCHSM